MARPQPRLNIQDPTLRPAASPVDTFYQPQPQIPGEAVDNIWLQGARALQALSPSLKDFLGVLEKQKGKKMPGEAEAAFEAFEQEPSDKTFEEAWRTERRLEAESIGPGEPLPPRLDTFSLTEEKTRFRQDRLRMTKRFASMGRKAAEAFLEENQKLFPGVTLNYAARPDFILHLQGLMGGAYAREAKEFKGLNGEMMTLREAIISRGDEIIQADDPEEIFRDVVSPLSDLDPKKGQAFRMGVAEEIDKARNLYGQYFIQKQLARTQKLSAELDRNRLVDIGIGIGSEAGDYMSIAQADEDPDDPAAVRRRENLEARMEEFHGVFDQVRSRVTIGTQDSRAVASDALKLTAEHLQDLDEDGYIFVAFLDRVRGWAADPTKPGGKTIGQTPYWNGALREIEDSLDRRQKGKEDRIKGDSRRAMEFVTSDLYQAFDALTEDKQGNITTSDDWLKLLQTDEMKEKVISRLEQVGYSRNEAEDLARGLSQDIADNESYSAKQRGAQLEAVDKELIESLTLQLSQEGGTSGILAAIRGSTLPPLEKSALLLMHASPEMQRLSKYGYRKAREAIRSLAEASLPDLSGGSLSTRDGLIRQEQANFDILWEAADDEGKRKLGIEGPGSALKRLHDSKPWDTLAESALSNSAEKVWDHFAADAEANAERAFSTEIQKEVLMYDAEGVLLTTITGPMTQPNPQYERQQQAAQMRFRVYGIAALQRLMDAAPDGQFDPSDVATWAPELINSIMAGDRPGWAPKDYKPTSVGELYDRSLGTPTPKEEKPALPTAAAQGAQRADADQIEEGRIAKFDEHLTTRSVLNVGRREWGIRSKDPLDEDGVRHLGVDPDADHGQALLSQGAASSEVADNIKGDAFEAFRNVYGEHFTAPDQRYEVKSREPQPAYRDPRAGVLGAARQYTSTDNPNFPSVNESNIFWLSSYLQGPQRELSVGGFEWDGDWHHQAGVDLAELNDAGMVKALKGEIVGRGLWLEEIVMGKTREGIDLTRLFGTDLSDIPWGHMVIGHANGSSWEQDIAAMMTTKGVLLKDWEETLLGKALGRMGINPGREDKRRGETEWDMFALIQTNLRGLRDAANVTTAQLLASARGVEDQRLPEFPATQRDPDQYLHNIMRLDTTAPNGHNLLQFLTHEQGGSGQPGAGTWAPWTITYKTYLPQRASEAGGGDHRMYNKIYKNSHARTRKFEAEAQALRGN